MKRGQEKEARDAPFSSRKSFAPHHACVRPRANSSRETFASASASSAVITAAADAPSSCPARAARRSLARGELAAVIAIELSKNARPRSNSSSSTGGGAAPTGSGAGARLSASGAAAAAAQTCACAARPRSGSAPHTSTAHARQRSRAAEPRVAELHLLERAQRAAKARALSGFEVRERRRARRAIARSRSRREETRGTRRADGREAEEDGRGVAAEAQAEVRSAVDGVAAAPHPTRWSKSTRTDRFKIDSRLDASSHSSSILPRPHEGPLPPPPMQAPARRGRLRLAPRIRETAARATRARSASAATRKSPRHRAKRWKAAVLGKNFGLMPFAGTGTAWLSAARALQIGSGRPRCQMFLVSSASTCARCLLVPQGRISSRTRKPSVKQIRASQCWIVPVLTTEPPPPPPPQAHQPVKADENATCVKRAFQRDIERKLVHATRTKKGPQTTRSDRAGRDRGASVMMP